MGIKNNLNLELLCDDPKNEQNTEAKNETMDTNWHYNHDHKQKLGSDEI